MDVEQMADFIVSVQKTDGEIPWSIGGKTDPWDHVESAMGLSVAGYWREAEQAYEWMRKTQHSDGSWYAAYRNNAPEDTTRETNMSSYIAVGVFHHYLITEDLGFLKRMWSTLRSWHGLRRQHAGADGRDSLGAGTAKAWWIPWLF